MRDVRRRWRRTGRGNIGEGWRWFSTLAILCFGLFNPLFGRSCSSALGSSSLFLGCLLFVVADSCARRVVAGVCLLRLRAEIMQFTTREMCNHGNVQ